MEKMEKMKVLQMLESGRITADEAANLLESLDGKKTSGSYHSHSAYSTRAADGARSNDPSAATDTRERERGGGYSDIAGELGRKIETFAKDMEPKLTKLTETVVEKTANVADRLSKSLADTSKATTYRSDERPAPRPAAPATRPVPTAPGASGASGAGTGTLSGRSFEIAVMAGYNELVMQGLNGFVLIKGYNGDKITARVSYKSKKYGAHIDLMRLGSKYCLHYDEDEFECINIDAYIPESLFNRIDITTVNGSVDVSTIKCAYLLISGSNAELKATNICADSFKISNDNSKITASNIYGDTGQIENFNGAVQVEMVDAANLSISTFNAAVSANITALDRFTNYTWKVETNNGKMSLYLPTHPAIGYDIKAQNTLGNIKIGLTGLNYILNTPTVVEAKSIDYATALKKVGISMETSNAPLILN